MKTDKFNKSAETFNDNVGNTMKWMQDSAALFLETQNKQLKFATDMYSQAINTSFENFSKGNFGNAFETSEKLAEMIQKNIESISKQSEENMKTIMEVSTKVNSELFSKEAMNQIIETYRKNAEAITSFNQNSFDALMKQSELAKQFIKPLTENFKTEFETNIQLFNETVKEMMGSFSNLTNPSFETNKNIFGELTNKMQTIFKSNLKSWTDLMSNYQADSFKSEAYESATKKGDHKEHHSSKNKLQPVHV